MTRNRVHVSRDAVFGSFQYVDPQRGLRAPAVLRSPLPSTWNVRAGALRILLRQSETLTVILGFPAYIQTSTSPHSVFPIIRLVHLYHRQGALQ